MYLYKIDNRERSRSHILFIIQINFKKMIKIILVKSVIMDAVLNAFSNLYNYVIIIFEKL